MILTLPRLNDCTAPEGPVLLIIMDGYGIGKEYEGNAIFKANKPHLDKYFREGMYTQLKAHGPAVGLPSDDDMGNSEVGHNALGAGRIFAQGAKLVNRAIADGSMFETELWTSLMEKHSKGGTLHFMGLLSDGNVHSHIDHLYAMIDRAHASGVQSLRVHVLLDGRDVDEKSALRYLQPLEEKLADISHGENRDYQIASGGGRMNVTMDRYNADWSVVKKGYDAHVLGKARQFTSASEAVRTFYNEDSEITDQYLDAFVVADDNGPVGRITDGDSVIFFNFRGDRAIEISRALTEKDFSEFDRGPLPDITFAGMMEYDGDLHIPPQYLVNPPSIERTMSEYLCAEGVTSFAISETQKFGHVTYFWNGNNSGYIDDSLEKYVEIPSDRIEFDKAPKMKAVEITDAAIELLDEGFRFGRINFANGDMVGHSGKLQPAITAIETVDECVGRLVEKVMEMKGIVLITADHGNSDEMFTEKNGERTPKTSHTLNPVPFCILDSREQPPYKLADIETPGLANVAATIFNLLCFQKPEDYEPSIIA
ncbi:2,3-bisphosphoglycerate-independent phosphoglycerate mutase [bacterium]|nr:2,3-bisphosphoglycerate-independent phosphoglycerate mutase [bacterium]